MWLFTPLDPPDEHCNTAHDTTFHRTQYDVFPKIKEKNDVSWEGFSNCAGMNSFYGRLNSSTKVTANGYEHIQIP